MKSLVKGTFEGHFVDMNITFDFEPSDFVVIMLKYKFMSQNFSFYCFPPLSSSQNHLLKVALHNYG